MSAHVETSLYELAARFLGQREIAGAVDNPWINAAHSLCGLGFDAGDEVPWCSSFTNMLAWLLGLERSKSAAARSWLKVGMPVDVKQWQRGDVVILSRGAGEQPGPHVIAAPGHVGILYEIRNGAIHLLGGNQGNAVTVAEFPISRVLGIRRLRPLN